MRPSNYDSKKETPSKPIKQLWQKSGSCPDGTIPILRTQKTDLLREISLEENSVAPGMENAKLYVDAENYGGQAYINVWSIYVEDGESNHGGCYNLLCPGFIQTNNNINMGGSISPLSIYGSEQYAIKVKIHKDPKNDHWWFSYFEVPIGYWPGSLFSNMKPSANYIEWGGQVYNRALGGRHTNTQMGSGHFAKEGGGKASSFDVCLYFNLQHDVVVPYNFPTEATKPSCYGISQLGHDKDRAGAGFFYGGPGGVDCDK
ncbi:neprosin 1 [Cinnamomum micranthum f. kanehirae]|uniref:Neprosin 1 n=1 Tax=Cinnamomum micranthum f. kanehirae TaxID=337451 RepID=A0A443N521_9MAGN|nr:neprosin 1 [Cinnamomum micranthum f. kanehirae]